MRINSMWYPIAQWLAAKRFYGELLGLTQTHCSDEMGWAAYDTGTGVPLFLVRKPNRAGVPGGAVVTFECENVDEVIARLKQAGVKVESSGAEGDSVRTFSIYDPDGNLLELSDPVK
ncbi:MAG: Glyoxalase-like domain [Symbiobacteriaceae bacterium]|jgi:predicted enzyme related to lactoylglutathione lyase|nr:Glyoxalase-like domain [Symbiobacteriaceae bacterium]